MQQHSGMVAVLEDEVNQKNDVSRRNGAVSIGITLGAGGAEGRKNIISNRRLVVPGNEAKIEPAAQQRVRRHAGDQLCPAVPF